MEVTSGAEWVLSTGNKQNYSVTLTDDDMKGDVGADLWENLSVRKCNSWMSAEADLLVVRHMASTGAITSEYAKSRISALKAQQEKALKPYE